MANSEKLHNKDLFDTTHLGTIVMDSLPAGAPVRFIRDTETKPKAHHKSLARSSLPHGLFLMPSALGYGRLGVYTTKPIEGRVVFGPFKGRKLSSADVTAHNYSNSWDVIKTETCEDHFTVDASDEQSSNWMRFVNCTHSEDQQNMVSFQQGGEIYYRTCKAIDSGSELLVWFDDFFYTKNSSTQAFHSSSCEGRNHFVCKNCNLVFLGPSYLHRHKEHRCPMLSESSPLQTEDNTHVESIADNKARASDRSVNTETTSAASPSKEYQCSQCDMSFKTSKLLLKHYRLHTDDFPYKCWTCGEGFRDKYSKLKHTEKHKGKLKCYDCGKRYSHKSAFQAHVCHGGASRGHKAFKCGLCEKTFKNKDCLQNHMPTHSEEHQFSCDVCDKQYTYRSALYRHKRIHTLNDETSHRLTDPDITRCIVCQKVFGDVNSLKVHQRTHSGERPFKCTQCGKCFAQGSTLVGHLRTHAAHPHKPFKCSDCGKCFARVADFHIHQRIHTGEKPYECDQCGKRFRLNSSLSKHRQVHLPVELRAANAKKNGSTVWNCEYCGKVFTINSHFRRHERTHTKPFKCAHCDKRFSRKEDLALHREAHSNEKHKCWVCRKIFISFDKMRTHICIHTGERPYTCPVCEKGYICHKNFRRHVRSHKTPSS